ncbi:PepSY domain-containing protein [Kitasatospora sp. NPDC059811]|uniref:PepSY domain-containing protein n=1 Tax=Streptomycetaceae TaxID=2062 RepID=UPI0007AF0CC2|nr:PepSY domain-containing protein [Streptomyces sp. MJM8645]
MSDATSSTTPLPEDPEGPADPEQASQAQPQSKRPRAARLRGWAGGRERRIAAGVAAVALIGAGGLVALAVAHEEHGRGDHRGLSRAEGGSSDEHGGRNGGGNGGGRSAHDGTDGTARSAGSDRGEGHAKRGRTAPAPLPSLAASTALEKAQGAVPGGRAESLRRVAQQGGSAAWAVVVVGPDGVRHLVTVDGTSGELTGNTVVDGSGR